MAASEADSNRNALVCNLGVMTEAERTRYLALSRKLMRATEERRELADGFEFCIESDQISLVEIAEWITFERRCCPFFKLQIEAAPDDGPVALRMTGAAGIKEFILAEIGG